MRHGPPVSERQYRANRIPREIQPHRGNQQHRLIDNVVSEVLESLHSFHVGPVQILEHNDNPTVLMSAKGAHNTQKPLGHMENRALQTTSRPICAASRKQQIKCGLKGRDVRVTDNYP